MTYLQTQARDKEVSRLVILFRDACILSMTTSTHWNPHETCNSWSKRQNETKETDLLRTYVGTFGTSRDQAKAGVGSASLMPQKEAFALSQKCETRRNHGSIF